MLCGGFYMFCRSISEAAIMAAILKAEADVFDMSTSQESYRQDDYQKWYEFSQNNLVYQYSRTWTLHPMKSESIANFKARDTISRARCLMRPLRQTWSIVAPFAQMRFHATFSFLNLLSTPSHRRIVQRGCPCPLPLSKYSRRNPRKWYLGICVTMTPGVANVAKSISSQHYPISRLRCERTYSFVLPPRSWWCLLRWHNVLLTRTCLHPRFSDFQALLCDDLLICTSTHELAIFVSEVARFLWHWYFSLLPNSPMWSSLTHSNFKDPSWYTLRPEVPLPFVFSKCSACDIDSLLWID